MAVVEVNKLSDFHSLVAQSNAKPMMVDVYAPWCAPCMRMLPVVHELYSESNGKFDLVTLNVDEAEPSLLDHLGIQSVPQIFLFESGVQQRNLSGLQTKTNLLDAIEHF